MLVVFEIHLAAGSDGASIFSDELLQSTQAQVMTAAEAKAVGFSGFGESESLRLVAVTPKDRGFVAAALERAADVTGFRVHEVDV
jgi:hypothetical protein